MDDLPAQSLLPVTPDELEQAVSHALRFDGRKHFKLAGEIMGKITAAHLVHCLEQGGFVVMKKPPPALGAAPPTWPQNLGGYAMPLLHPQPEPVPFEEVAAVLDKAAMHARGGPPYLIPCAGWHFAAALNDAGFHVVRAPADTRQLTL